jgi:hypothetical protein
MQLPVPLSEEMRSVPARMLLKKANEHAQMQMEKLGTRPDCYAYNKPLTWGKNVWEAERCLDGAPVVIKQLIRRDTWLDGIDMTEMWASLIAHQRVAHALPVLDVFVDKCRCSHGLRDRDTPALAFPRLLPLVPQHEPHAFERHPHSLLNWRAALAILIALCEHVQGLCRIKCAHLDLKPEHILVTTYDWSRITPNDVFIFDFDNLTYFGYIIDGPVGTQGFIDSHLVSLEEGGRMQCQHGFDLGSFGRIIRHMQGKWFSKRSVQKSQELSLLAGKLCNWKVDMEAQDAMPTLLSLCRKHRVSFA